MWSQCSRDLPHFRLWICNFNDQVIELLVVESYDYRVVRVVDVVEDAPAVLVKRTSSENTRDLSTGHTNAVPPSACGFGVYRCACNVNDGDLDLALERPESVHSLHVENDYSIGDRYLDQVYNSFGTRGKKIRCSWIEWKELSLGSLELLCDVAPAASFDFYDEVLDVVRANSRNSGYLSERARPNCCQLVARFEG